MFMTPGTSGAREVTRKPEPPELGPKKMRGLGDVVAAGLERVGIKKRKGCGCGKRQAMLNKLIPFKS